MVKEIAVQDKSAVIQQVKRSKQLIKSFRKRKGMKFYELDLESGNIAEAKPDSVTAGYKAGVQNRVEIKPGKIYVTAVNVKNAERKFIPMVNRLITVGSVLEIIENSQSS